MSGASFSRILPLLPIPAGTDAPAPLFRLSLNRFAHTSNTSCVHDTKDSILNCQEQVDPKIFITSSNSSPLALCYTLEVAVLLRASTADTAELFFSSPLSKRFSPERSSKIAVVGGNDFQELHFFLSSADGFGTEFRLDPVAKTQPFEVKEVEMRCRIGNVLKRENITLPYSPRR